MSDKIEDLLTSLREVLEQHNDIDITQSSYINFKENIVGKGILWTTKGSTKQILFIDNPNRFFVSENLDLAKNRSLSINNITVLKDTELGSTVTKSHLTEVGILKGLIVDGNVSINGTSHFVNNKLGIGTDLPDGTLHLKDDCEFIIKNGNIGTISQNSVNIIAGNSTKITVTSTGAIELGNSDSPPSQVSIHGKLAIKVKTPDPEVDLHISGAIKFSNKLQKVDRNCPSIGVYNTGDIVWNSEPRVNQYVGWICVQSGNPGIWEPFGKIGNS